jgi:hypothetical protein
MEEGQIVEMVEGIFYTREETLMELTCALIPLTSQVWAEL